MTTITKTIIVFTAILMCASAAEAKGCNPADVLFGKVKIEITRIAR